MSTASVYNLARESRSILKRFRKASPSLSIELYPKHFRFKGQTGIFLYDSPMKAFLESIRAQQIPHDLLPYLPSPQIPYYDGCLIVELIDHRPTANVHPSVAAASSDATGSAKPSSNSSKPDGQPAGNAPPTAPLVPPSTYHGPGGKGPPPVRVVLHPTPASLWSDVCAMSEDVGQGSWDDWDVLQLEARIVAATAPPLYLGTSFYGTRIANASIAQTSPLAPPEAQQPYHAESSTSSGLSARKKARAHGSSVQRRDEMESQKSLYQVGEIRKQVGFQPNFSRLTQIEAFRSNPASNRPRSLASDISSTHPGLPPPSGAYPNYNPRPSGSGSGSGANVAVNIDVLSGANNPAGSTATTGAEEGIKAARRASVTSSVGGDIGQDEQSASEPIVSEKKKTKKKKKKAQAEEQAKDVDMDEPDTPVAASAPTPVDTPITVTTSKSKKGKNKKAAKASEEAVPQTPASDSAPTPSTAASAASTAAAKKGRNKKTASGAAMSPESHPPKKKQKTSTTTTASSAPTPGGTALPLGPPPVPSQAGHPAYAQKQPPPSSSPYVSSKTLPPTYPTGRPLAGGPNGAGGGRIAQGQGTGAKTLPGMQNAQQLQMLQQHFQTQQGYPMQGMGMPTQGDGGQSGNSYMGGGGVGSFPQQGQGW